MPVSALQKPALPLMVSLLLCFAAAAQVSRVKIGQTSTPGTDVSLKLVARIQSNSAYVKTPFDFYDKSINSPKSALILERMVNGQQQKKLYINSLEGGETVVYDMNDNFKKLSVIKHTFTQSDSSLFKETDFEGYTFKPGRQNQNTFTGKPVEMCLSNNDRYLWIPYYRRDYDKLAEEPSAIALIDVNTDQIIRVFPTAPLPKMVAASADDKYVAVTNWGDNTVHLIDISSGDPAKFSYAAHFVVDHKLILDFKTHVDRDQECGLCLRGTVFTPDNNYLFVGRMGGGGIAVFDTKAKKYMGTIFGTKSNVRHLVIKGDYLFLSSNTDGLVERTKWKDMLDYFIANPINTQYKNWDITYSGLGARTISITSGGYYLFATANKESKISIIRTADMKVIGSVKTDSYPVGMTIDKANKYLVVTAQGRNNKGGNSVMIYEISRN